MGGQRVLVTRTEWTGEIGWEYYRYPDTDCRALWKHIMKAGEPAGMVHSGLDAMDIRHIEAAILNSGSDFDRTMNPYQAGLDAFVDMKKTDFIGKAALAVADRRPMLHGVRCADAEPLILGPAMQSGEAIGLVTAGAWSPYLQCGIGYVRWRTRRTSRANGSRSWAWTERRTRQSASNSPSTTGRRRSREGSSPRSRRGTDPLGRRHSGTPSRRATWAQSCSKALAGALAGANAVTGIRRGPICSTSVA